MVDNSPDEILNKNNNNCEEDTFMNSKDIESLICRIDLFDYVTQRFIAGQYKKQ